MKTIVLLVLAAPFLLLAQVDQATLVGTVADASGALIPDAEIVLTSIGSGVPVRTQTNAAGIYRLPYLKAGSYKLSVTKTGFKLARVDNITLTVGLTATVNVGLEVGSVDTAVDVTATAVQLESESSSLGTTVEANQMVELPLLGRDPYYLVSLAPGVLPVSGTDGGVWAQVTGGRTLTSSVLLDGAESRDTTTQNIAYTPPLEAVQEFKLITNNSTSEYGRSGAGVITATTRSGTNEFHGSAYEFFRNDKLNANGWQGNRLALDRSAFHRNEYGFSLGGPVKRNRTFFFGNLEFIPQRTPSLLNATVPTEAEKTGDFSRTIMLNGRLINIYDPATTRPNPSAPGQYMRDPFPGNRIPAQRIDPVVARAITYYPTPNRSTPTENFVLNQATRNDTWRVFLRGDHQVGRHRIFASFGRNNNTQVTDPLNIAFPGEGTNWENGKVLNTGTSAALNDAVMLSPHLIGEFRATFSRGGVDTQIASEGFDLTQLGFSDAVKAQAKSLVFPRFEPADVASLGPARASFWKGQQGTYGGQANFTWIVNSHSVKSGAEYMFFYQNVRRPNWPSGYYTFARAYTQGPNPLNTAVDSGYGFATMLLGAPSGGQISDDPFMAASQKGTSWYVQDDWKITRNLTLNLGIRWDYQTPWTDRYNHLAYFDRGFPDPLTGRNGLLRFASADGNPRTYNDPDTNNYAPRAGIAWRLTERTAIRAGYGLFYSPGGGGIGAATAGYGAGWSTATSVYLGQPPAAPNTPPEGASVANAFQAGFLKSPDNGVGTGISTHTRDWPVPYNQQWNFNVQRMLRGNILAEAAYIGNRGRRLWRNYTISAPNADYLSLGSQLDQLVPNPFYGEISTGTLSARTVRQSALLGPYPHYNGVTLGNAPVGDSIYHAMTLRVAKQWSNGLQFQVSYTISKLIDNVPERFFLRSVGISDPNNMRLSRSVSEFDRPQFLVMNWVYDLPLGRGKAWLNNGPASAILGGWQVSGIARFGKGLPIAITGPNNTRTGGLISQAVRTGNGILPSGQQTLENWFRTSDFQAAPLYSLGNDSRTEPSLRGPGINMFNLTGARNFRIRERFRLQVRCEFFNAFNTPQFGDPVNAILNRDFGRVRSAGQPRQIQLGMRLTF